MKTKINIKSPRQRRALEVLLAHPEGVACKDLGRLIGAINSNQVILELRRQGMQDGIDTEYFVARDRDGKKCRPGMYKIPVERRNWVQQVLNENATRTVAPDRMATVIESLRNGSRGGIL